VHLNESRSRSFLGTRLAIITGPKRGSSSSKLPYLTCPLSAGFDSGAFFHNPYIMNGSHASRLETFFLLSQHSSLNSHISRKACRPSKRCLIIFQKSTVHSCLLKPTIRLIIPLVASHSRLSNITSLSSPDNTHIPNPSLRKRTVRQYRPATTRHQRRRQCCDRSPPSRSWWHEK
jgi:hypothetical protein